MAISPRTPRTPTRRRKAGPSVGELVERLAAVEKRLACVEEGKAPPGDGRSAAKPVATKAPRRCLGCGLPLRRRRAAAGGADGRSRD